MINKIKNTKNGYAFTDSSTDADFQVITQAYRRIHCIICNKNTACNFEIGMLGHSVITINNKLADGVFFINGVY